MAIHHLTSFGRDRGQFYFRFCSGNGRKPNQGGFAVAERAARQIQSAAVARHGKLPPRRHEELPPPWIAEERANERGTNHGKPVVERSTGAGDEDAGRCGGDVAPEGVRVASEADCAAAGLQPSHGEGLRGGGRGEAVEVT